MTHEASTSPDTDMPADLVRAAADRELIVVVGVGIPQWDELFDGLLLSAIEQASTSTERRSLLEIKDEWRLPRGGGWDWASKKQFLIEALGETPVREFIAMHVPRGQPGRIHDALANLAQSAIFINLAGDGCLEMALEKQLGKRPEIILPNVPTVPPMPGQVVALHGIGGNANELLLAGEYELARFWRKIRQQSNAALVVGFGMHEDPSSISTISYAGDGWYWLVEKGRLRAIQASRRGLQPLWLDDADETVSWLQRLADSVERQRAERTITTARQDSTSPSNFKRMAVRVAERFIREQHRRQTAWDEYWRGQLSFEALCAETKQSGVEVVTQLFERMNSESGFISAPVEVGNDAPPALDGVHILMSALELSLLQRLGLLSTLLESIGHVGKLLLFSDVADNLLDAPTPPDAVLQLSSAMHLQHSVQQTLRDDVTSGRMEVILRPSMNELPPLKELQGLSEAKKKDLETRRFWWNRALQYRQSLAEHPERRLVAADYSLLASPGKDVELELSLDWKVDEFERFAERMMTANDHALRIPPIVRALVPDMESRLDLLVQLARLGFADALDEIELLALARHHGGLDSGVVTDVLDGTSWMAKCLAHPGSPVAQIHVANHYASTIWRLYTVDSDWSSAEQESVLTRLLQRAEKMDIDLGTDILDKLLMFLLGQAIARPRHSFVPAPDDEEKLQTSATSSAGRLWKDLVRWIGTDGRRRSAFSRAARCACLKLDEMVHPGKPRLRDFAPLLLVIQSATQRSLFEPLTLTTAILSAAWDDKPLRHEGIGLQFSNDAATNVTYEAILDAAVRMAHSPHAMMSERSFGFPYRIAEKTDTVRFLVPIEAMLLRLPPNERRDYAAKLAWMQGPLDGRAYEYLHDLEKMPDQPSLWHEYARMTVAAPWRLVREDPAYLRTWRSRAPDDGVFPNDLHDLQKMLSEPLEPFPENGNLGDLLVDRGHPPDCWGERTDYEKLFRLALEIPGCVSFLLTPLRFNRQGSGYHEEVELALGRLRQPNDFCTGQICSDVYFLRYAATHKPLVKTHDREIDLRDELPNLLGDVLRSTLNPREKSSVASTPTEEPIIATQSATPTSDQKSLVKLAKVEDSIIRLCGRVIGQLSFAGHVPARHGTWLSHRLFRWLWDQLEALSPDARIAGLETLHKFAPLPQRIAGDDLLHPRRLDRERHDYRLASILLAFFLTDILGQKYPPAKDFKPNEVRAVSSPGIEAVLIELASRPLDEDERALRLLGSNASSLDWFGPAAVPDIALSALLALNAERFVDIVPEARIRWIQDIPRDREHRLSDDLAKNLWRTCERYARKLTDDEKGLLETHAREGKVFAAEDAELTKWSMLTALFLAGRAYLKEDARKLLDTHLAHPTAPAQFGHYIAGLSFHTPARIHDAATQVLAEVESRGLDPVPFALNLEGAMYSGRRVGIRHIHRVLLDCAARLPYKDDDRFRIMLASIGLSGRS